MINELGMIPSDRDMLRCVGVDASKTAVEEVKPIEPIKPVSEESSKTVIDEQPPSKDEAGENPIEPNVGGGTISPNVGTGTFAPVGDKSTEGDDNGGEAPNEGEKSNWFKDNKDKFIMAGFSVVAIITASLIVRRITKK